MDIHDAHTFYAIQKLKLRVLRDRFHAEEFCAIIAQACIDMKLFGNDPRNKTKKSIDVKKCLKIVLRL